VSNNRFSTLVKCECSFEIFTELKDDRLVYRIRMKLDGLPEGFQALVSNLFGGAENGMEAWSSASGPAPYNNYITFLPRREFIVSSVDAK
jgi:hypothetical protein